MSLDFERVAKSIGLSPEQVRHTTELLDAGNTIPFITRYRRDQTGGLDEEQIHKVQASVGKLRQLEERKQTILRMIESQGKLTPALQRQITRADNVKHVEDLYLPYKPKKQTLATAARDAGLEPLAEEILAGDPACAELDARADDFVNADRQVATTADALLGAGHILAEQFSERAELRQKVRKIFRNTGRLVSTKAEPNEQQSKQFRDYLEFREPLGRVPPHRVLAINRGERAKALRVKIEVAEDRIEQEAIGLLVPPEHAHAEFLRGCVRDALARLILPSLEREARREMTEKAEAHAVEVFARNLGKLLLQPPVRGRRVLAVDPGFKSGCKLAALDEFGGVLAVDTIYLIGSDERKAVARAKVIQWINTYDLSLVAIGNGTACREAEELVGTILAEELQDRDVAYVVVNEAGASVYSTSALGREELPDYEAIQRSAVSIGRRLQDPLSELVKIDPASIGVGLYQHDAKAKHLRSSLESVVQSCVSYVGVDVNTASAALLRYASGLNQLTARHIFEYRGEHGPFKNRQQLTEVPNLGEATFVQAAGFLKIDGGENPLDATWIHPESYEVAEKVLEKLDVDRNDLKEKDAAARIAEKVAELDTAALAAELGVGELLLSDVIDALARPGRDPREDLAPPLFRKGIVKLDDLEVGMELSGSVLNVVDFGVFVDIGIADSGLVHVSQLANRYIRDPHDVVSVGDTVKVWVTTIDKSRRRVALTMIEPGTEVTHEPRRPRRKPQEKKPDGAPGGPGDAPRTARRPGKRRPTQGDAKRSDTIRGGDKRPRYKKPPAKPRKSTPQVPITKEMEEGREPMRTFGDLLQFHEKKKQPPSSESE